MKRIIALILFLKFHSVLNAQMPLPPILQPGENYTNLWSVSYDFQTNGSLRYLLQNPSQPNQWCAILMAQHDSNTALGIKKYIYYSYSQDNGLNWIPGVIDTLTNYGYPCITLSNGIPVIACHKNSNTGSLVFKESSFGAYNFSPISPLPVISPPPIWPHITGTSNGNLVLAAASNLYTGKNSSMTTFNGNSWTPFTSIPLTNGTSGNFDIVSGLNGKAAIVGVDNAETSALAWYQSTNNGISFNGGSVIMNYILTGGDTLYASTSGGFQAIYDNLGYIHVVFAAYNINYNAVFSNSYTFAYKKPSLYHWSSQTNTFTKIADRNNIQNLTDTLTQYGVEPICQPSMTITSSGKLICAFTAYLRGNEQIVENGDVVNAGEIFYTVSADNGTTWSLPQNLTNTPLIEEKHPSLPQISISDSLRVFYLRDMKAGAVVVVSEWGRAPVYGIFNNLNLNNPPPAPLLLNPQNNSVQNPITPLLRWETSGNAKSYEVQLARDLNFNDIILDQSVLVNEFNVPSSILNYDSVYFWRVNATNSNGTGNWSVIWNFRTTTFLPLAPSQLSPANGSIEVTFTPTLDWNEALFTSSYNLQVSLDSNFSNTIISQLSLNVSQYTIPGSILTAFTSYYWRVNSNNSNGTGNWSSIWRFKTYSIPSAPVLVFPPNDTTGISKSPVLKWQSVSNAVRYQVLFSDDSNFIQVLINDSNITNIYYSNFPFILNLNTRYFWKVKSINDAGSSPWSEIWNFRTTLTSDIYSITSNIPDEYFLFNNFPNPFNPSTKIKFDLPKSKYTSLSIYDISGREITILINEILNAGSYEIVFSADKFNLSSGIYFYKLETGNFVETKRMILLK